MYVVSREEIIPISALSSGEKQIPYLPLQPKREELSNNGQGYIERVVNCLIRLLVNFSNQSL